MDFLDIILNLKKLSLLQLHNNVSPWTTHTKDVMMVNTFPGLVFNALWQVTGMEINCH